MLWPMEVTDDLPVFGPTVLLELLATAPWPGGWRVAGARNTADAGARRGRPVSVELIAGERAVTLELAHREDRDNAYAHVGDIAIGYWPPATPEDAVPLCEVVARTLTTACPRFLFLPPSDVAAPEPGSGWDARPPRGATVGPSALAAEEQRALKPLVAAYPRFHAGHALVLRQQQDGGVVLTFPAPATPDDTFLLAPRRFASNQLLRTYFERLGYGWDADGRVRTVPTPATFRARVHAGAGFLPRLLTSRWRTVPARAWLSHLCSGELPINVGTRALFGALQPLRLPALASSRRATTFTSPLFHALGHDMSTHVLLLHRIPPGHVAALGREIDRAAAPLVLRSGPFAPMPLLRFFENDLTRACRDIWVRIDRPQDFTSAFESALPEIRDQMHQRVAAVGRRRAHRLYFHGTAWLE